MTTNHINVETIDKNIDKLLSLHSIDDVLSGIAFWSNKHIEFLHKYGVSDEEVAKWNQIVEHLRKAIA